MRSRLPVLVALALALCALPSVHAFAAASCTPCCAEMGGSADPGCGVSEADCCALAPTAPVAPVEPLNPQLVAFALLCAPLAIPPSPASFAPRVQARAVSPLAPPARLSVVRLL